MFYQLFDLLIEANIRVPGTYFGISEAGWIHTNGKLEILPNYHAGDHDLDAYQKLNPGEIFTVSSDTTGAYQEYLKQGHIRFIQSKRGFNIELTTKPTVSQMGAVRKGIKEGTGEFYFSVRKRGTYGADGSSWEEFREEMSKL